MNYIFFRKKVKKMNHIIDTAYNFIYPDPPMTYKDKHLPIVNRLIDPRTDSWTGRQLHGKHARHGAETFTRAKRMKSRMNYLDNTQIDLTYNSDLFHNSFPVRPDTPMLIKRHYR